MEDSRRWSIDCQTGTAVSEAVEFCDLPSGPCSVETACTTTQTSSARFGPAPNFNLAGKVALITGAARGIGRACAIALAAELLETEMA
jgi:hypothetical protein